MPQPLPLPIPAGIVTDGSRYALKGRWISSHWIRFSQGLPQSMGGWTAALADKLDGVCRSILAFASLSGDRHVAFGTHRKFYVWHRLSDLNEVTPLVASGTLPANPLQTTLDSTTVSLNAGTAEVAIGSTIIVSGAAATNGIPADELNGSHLVTAVLGTVVSFEVTTPATATGSGGGAGVVVDVLYLPGNVDSVATGGWGYGDWGEAPWGGEVGSGAGSSASGQVVPLRIWHLDNWGEDLIVNPTDGPIFYWDQSAATARAAPISGMPGASQVPEVARKVVVFDRSRIVIALATNPIGSLVQDPMLVRWSDNENYLEWNPLAEGSAAGELRLSAGSVIVAGIKAPNEVLVWTDTSLYAIRDTGTNDIFAASILSPKMGIAGPNAAVIAGDSVYWFALTGFFRYVGNVQTVACPVEQFVTAVLDFARIAKTVACANEAFNEVMWNMVSRYSSNGEPDFYVKFNYVDNAWDIGRLDRTAWFDNGILAKPIATKPDGRVVYHEVGWDDAAEPVSLPIFPSITSGPVEADQNGYHFIFCSAVIPDVRFAYDAPPSPTPSVSMAFLFDKFPGNATSEMYLPEVVTAQRMVEPAPDPLASLVVTPHTLQPRFRGRGRSVALEITKGPGLGYGWRLGVQRLVVRADGRK